MTQPKRSAVQCCGPSEGLGFDSWLSCTSRHRYVRLGLWLDGKTSAWDPAEVACLFLFFPCLSWKDINTYSSLFFLFNLQRGTSFCQRQAEREREKQGGRKSEKAISRGARLQCNPFSISPCFQDFEPAHTCTLHSFQAAGTEAWTSQSAMWDPVTSPPCHQLVQSQYSRNMHQ